MTFNADALKLLVDKGFTGEDIVALALCLEKAFPVDSAAEKRRAYDRRRKAEKRLEEKSTGHSTGFPPDPSPNERDNLTPTRESKTEPEGSSKSLGEIEKRAAVAACLRQAFPPPDGVGGEVWADFLKSPKRKKAGMSNTAYAGICQNLRLLAEHGFPPGDMIALAVERGWTTVKLEWIENDRRRLGYERPDSNPTATALSRVQAAIRGGGAVG